MPDVDQVVDLHAVADHRIAQRPAVDAGVGADLDVIAHHDPADLRKFLIRAVLEDKTESVGSDHAPGVQDAARANLRPGIDLHPAVQQAISPDHRTCPNDRPGVDHRVRAQHSAFFDHRPRPDPNARAQLCRGGDRGVCVYSRRRPRGRLQRRQSLRKRIARPRDPDHSAALRRAGEILRNHQAARLAPGCVRARPRRSRNAKSPSPAGSSVAAPVISTSPSPSSTASNRRAMAAAFIRFRLPSIVQV